jgi:stage III sporulation protein AE
MKQKQANKFLIILSISVFCMFCFTPFLKQDKRISSSNLIITTSENEFFEDDFDNCFSISNSTLLQQNTTNSVMQSASVQDIVGKNQPTLYNQNNEKTEQSQTEKDLYKSIEDQLGNLNIEEIEKLLDGLDEKTKDLYGAVSFKDKIKNILSGDFKLLGGNALEAVGSLLLGSISSLVPLMASIVSIGILSGMLNQVRSDKGGKSIGDIIHFVCYGLILIMVTTSVYKLLQLTSSSLTSIKGLIDGVFPVLLTLLTAVGGTVSASVYQPAIALLSGSIIQVFNSILVPIFIFSFAFSVISNFSSGIKLTKFSGFLNSLFKWIIGAVFTVFIAFVSIQGLTAGSFDGISVKTAKFAVKNSIPFLGGYLAEGFNIIIASSVLIKNAIGVSGLAIMLLNVMAPIISIAVFSLFCKLTASILEPVTDGRISSFMFGVSKSVSMLSAILIGVAFMFMILTGLVMFTANFI